MSYQTDLANTKNLIRDAVEKDILKSLSDYMLRNQIAHQYEFSSQFRREFLKESISSYEDLLEAVGKIMRRLYKKQTQEDKLSEFKYVLSRRGFSNNFIHAFDRLATKQLGRKSDILTMHFSKDLSLRELAQLEDVIDSMYRDIVRADELTNWQIKRRIERKEPIIRIRQFTHPGSCEVFIDCRDALILAETVIASGAVIIFSAMAIIQARRNRREQMIVGEFREAAVARQNAIAEQVNQQISDEIEDEFEVEEHESEDDQFVAISTEKIEVLDVPQRVVETLEDATQQNYSYALANADGKTGGMQN